MLNWVDYAIVGVILLSAVISLWRGFTKEALSLLGWILAFWVALTFSPQLQVKLSGLIDTPSIRLAAAFVLLFLATLSLAALVNFLVGQLVDKTGLTGTDRMLGMVFGVARGFAIVAVLVLLAGLTALPTDRWWRESHLLGHFEPLAVEIRSLLPADMARYFSY